MEQVITKLLEEFDLGKMNRRQLIKSLAVMATATSGAATAFAAADEPAGFKAVHINHVSFDVHDYTKMRDFYADLFGMKVSDDNGKQCRLYLGPTHLSMANITTGTPRLSHICIEVEKYDKKATAAELKRRGIPLARFSGDGDPVIKDPEGFEVEFAPKGGNSHEQPGGSSNSG